MMLDLDRLNYLSPYDNEYYQLSDMKKKVEEVKTYMLDYKGSIRQCAKETGIPKSTVSRIIHTYIKEYYYEDYRQIVCVLDFNSKYRRKPRRYWKGNPW